MAKTGPHPFFMSQSKLSKRWEQKGNSVPVMPWGYGRQWFSVLFHFVNLQPLVALSPLDNPRKSGFLIPPSALSPLESCQMIRFKIDEVTSKSFKEVRDCIYNCGKVYESQNPRLVEAVGKYLVIVS